MSLGWGRKPAGKPIHLKPFHVQFITHFSCRYHTFKSSLPLNKRQAKKERPPFCSCDLLLLQVMENIGIVSSPKMVLGLSSNPRNPFFGLPHLPKRPFKTGRIARPATCFEVVSCFQGPRLTKKIVLGKLGRDSFACTTTSGGQQTSSVGVNPQFSAPSPPSQVGSPLFWIGVGVGLSALFSWVASYLKKYAMQQAFKTMMGQMNSQNNQFSNTAFSPGSPFPFPPPPVSGPASPSPSPATASTSSTPSASFASQPVTVDVSATKVEEPPAANVKNEIEAEKRPKKNAFVDVSPDETFQKGAFENFKESTETASVTAGQATHNGAASQSEFGANISDSTSSTGKPNPLLSVDAVEKMMEDPTVQKMVYPYLPEEMRNPTTFKWMLQNPQYRQQLQDMMNNMGGSPEWDNRMMDSLKNFDLSNPEIKQQFDQIGLTPEEVISKIMANPDVAMAFQNPRVQAAIMDCSQNPLSIAKYQNDKEVMDVFIKISELFPGVSGSP